jgi:hypothetical protein
MDMCHCKKARGEPRGKMTVEKIDNVTLNDVQGNRLSTLLNDAIPVKFTTRISA